MHIQWNHIKSCSIASFIVLIWSFNCDASFEVTEHEMTGLETPHARPSATLEGTKTYGTFYDDVACVCVCVCVNMLLCQYIGHHHCIVNETKSNKEQTKTTKQIKCPIQTETKHLMTTMQPHNETLKYQRTQPQQQHQQQQHQ